MPRKAKDKAEIIEENKVIKKEVKSKKETKVASKTSSKTTSAKTATKKVTSKTNSTKKASTKSVSKKTAPSKKKENKKSTKLKKETVTTKKTTKKEAEVLEYYDLPYRYNQTIVRVLAQTPTTLFVYWDISDEDKNKYIEQYGEYFFNNTKPVLIVHNKTKNYDFEVDINDFANSWYLNLPDSNCDYQVELGRRPINEYVTISNNYLPITYSNDIDSPNDHILFDHLSNIVYFKNVKNNKIIEKNIVTISLLRKIGKLCSIQDFYRKLYPEEVISVDKLDLKNPSSSNPTSSFK